MRVFPPLKPAVFTPIRSNYILTIKAEARLPPIAVVLITKAAGQMSRPEAVIMWGNDTVSREQIKNTQKRTLNSATCSLNTSRNCKSMCGAAWAGESASFRLSTLSSNKSRVANCGSSGNYCSSFRVVRARVLKQRWAPLPGR